MPKSSKSLSVRACTTSARESIEGVSSWSTMRLSVQHGQAQRQARMVGCLEKQPGRAPCGDKYSWRPRSSS
jgi:hypothetical protein